MMLRFSFLKFVLEKNRFWINSDLGKQILKHEMVQNKNTVLINCLSKLFNRCFGLIQFLLHQKEITLIHEYLADKKAVKNADTRAFAQMLLAE